MNMGGPAWLAGLVAVVTLAITAYCLSRLVAGQARGRPTDADVDATHALMGVGMAAMLVPSLSPVPAVTWSWVFAVVAIWLAWRIARVHRQGPAGRIAQAHYVPHLVMSIAMIYMGAITHGSTLGGSAVGGMAMGGPGAAPAGFPPLTLLLALLLFGYGVWLLDQLPGIPSVRAWRAAPQLALAPAAGAAVAVGGQPAPAVAVRSAAPVVRAALAAHAGAGAAAAAAHAGAATRPDVGVAAGRGVPLSPRLEAGCHIAMAVAMGYMLIVMV
jgi:hypothetical protein